MPFKRPNIHQRPDIGRFPIDRAALIRNLDCLLLHRSSDPLQEFLLRSGHRKRSIAQAIQRLRAFLDQRAPKPIRPCGVNRKSEPLRNPLQDKLWTALAQDDPPQVGIISHLGRKGHQVAHASGPPSDGYRPTQHPRIFSQRYSSLGKARALQADLVRRSDWNTIFPERRGWHRRCHGAGTLSRFAIRDCQSATGRR